MADKPPQNPDGQEPPATRPPEGIPYKAVDLTALELSTLKTFFSTRQRRSRRLGRSSGAALRGTGGREE
jgi:hypothetical protein